MLTLNKTTWSVIALTAALTACSSDDDANSDTDVSNGDAPAGVVNIASVRSVPEAIGALQTAFDDNDAITALATVDHQANAQSVDLSLRPTSVILFGNPALGTALMQSNQQAGLDLPLKMLATEGEDGATEISYNAPGYLQQRHSLTGVDEQLATMTTALGNFAAVASGNTDEDMPAAPTSVGEVSANQGVIVVPSEQDMMATYSTLRGAIDAAEPLRLVAELDHADNAESIGQELLPTRLIVFGNPNLGTPLMQGDQSVAIDLPQKMLVFENAAGEVSLAYNDPAYLAARHGILGQEELIGNISTALSNLATQAATAP